MNNVDKDMKQAYISPELNIYHIVGKEALLEPSLPVGGNVDDGSDIGFVKRDRGAVDHGTRGGHSVWDDDWSKQ